MDFWKVVYVNSRAEKKVTEMLLKKGIECYLPLKKEMKQWSDRKKLVVSPLINGYVFVKPQDALQRDAILQQSAVIQYVRYNGGDAIIKQNEIDAMRSIEEKGYFVEGHFGNPGIGDEAIIKYGPFKGLKGIVKSLAGTDEYTLMIDSLDYSLTLRILKEVLVKS